MIIEEIKNIKSNKTELRKFGITMCVALGLLGGMFFWRGKDFYPYLLILSAACMFLGIIIPIILKPIHKAWMILAVLMGFVMTRVIMTLLFYLIVTPIAFVVRLFGKDFLGTRLNRDVESYWVEREVLEFDKQKYENQF
jgi:hypothetical protein